MPDPAAIQEQIEQTRAELADTIDAIADRVSPKRAAARGIDTVKAKVDDLRTHQNGAAGTTGTTTRRTVRWDRVAAAGGVAVLVAWFIRRRRRS